MSIPRRQYLDSMKKIALVLVLFIAAFTLAGCIGQGITGKWCGKAETTDFTLTVDLVINPDGSADYDIIKLKKNEQGLSEFFGTLNWTIDEDNQIILYDTNIKNPYRVLKYVNGTLIWGTLYTGIDYVPLTRSCT